MQNIGNSKHQKRFYDYLLKPHSNWFKFLFTTIVTLAAIFINDLLKDHFTTNFYFIGVAAVALIAATCGLIPSLFSLIILAFGLDELVELIPILQFGSGGISRSSLLQLFVFLITSIAIALIFSAANKAYLTEQSQKDKLIDERELRDKFVNLLTHDLRNPLTAAKLGLETLDRIQDPDKRNKSKMQIMRSLERIERMTQNILDANRIKTGEIVPLQLQHLNLNDLLKLIVEDGTQLFPQRIILKINDKIEGYWSPEGLERIIENLIVNASKYGDPKTPITLSAEKVSSDRIKISVHNFGPPLPHYLHQTLFNPFYRSREAIHSGKEGWGLGLTIVDGLTRAHGGTPSVSSDAHHGTTFSLEVPLDSRPYQTQSTNVPGLTLALQSESSASEKSAVKKT